MSFLSNIFLWLLPLISIPLIIHILNRRKIVRIDFSSIQFLESLKSDSIKKINILQWLLLVIRTLIVLLIILMMLRPILRGYYPQMEVDPNSSLSVVVIDDSFSLKGKIDNRNRSEIIYEKYQQILNSFNDRTQVCIISTSKGVLYEGINANLPDLSKLMLATSKKGKLNDYMDVINKKFDNSIINKEVFIITDGQSSFFENISMGDTTDWKVYFVLLSKLKSNLKINYGKILNKIIVSDKIMNIEVEIENNGLNRVDDKMVNIFVNEINVGMQNISLDPNKKKIISFSTVFPNSKSNLIKISIADDDNNFDNNYYINMHIPANIKILSVFNKPDNMTYISNVITAINEKTPIFNHSTISYLDLDMHGLDNYDIVIVYDYSIIEFHYNLFDQYLNEDNHLIVFPEKNNDLNQLYGIIENLEKDKKYISLKNEIYEKVSYSEVISDNDINIDIDEGSFIQIFKYIQKSINPNSMIPIGELHSFWDKIQLEDSLIDIFYTSFHLDWNNFPLKGAFIQFINELIYSGYNNEFYNKLIEDDFKFTAKPNSKTQNTTHINPKGHKSNLTSILGFVQSEEFNTPGVHRFYNENDLIYSISVNIHPDELISKILTTKQIEEKMGFLCYFFENDEEISSSIINDRQGYELWRYLLWLLCFMIIIEMLLSNGTRET